MSYYYNKYEALFGSKQERDEREAQVVKLPFDDNDVEFFIGELRQAKDPQILLEESGCEVDDDVAGMLKEMACVWLIHPDYVHAASGTWFWRVMKSAALVQYNKD